MVIISLQKTGKWCAMHVRIAWDIYKQEQQKRKTPASKESASTSSGKSTILNTLIQEQWEVRDNYSFRNTDVCWRKAQR